MKSLEQHVLKDASMHQYAASRWESAGNGGRWRVGGGGRNTMYDSAPCKAFKCIQSQSQLVLQVPLLGKMIGKAMTWRVRV